MRSAQVVITLLDAGVAAVPGREQPPPLCLAAQKGHHQAIKQRSSYRGCRGVSQFMNIFESHWLWWHLSTIYSNLQPYELEYIHIYCIYIYTHIHIHTYIYWNYALWWHLTN